MPHHGTICCTLPLKCYVGALILNPYVGALTALTSETSVHRIICVKLLKLVKFSRGSPTHLYSERPEFSGVGVVG